jgi:hypothetical protein
LTLRQPQRYIVGTSINPEGILRLATCLLFAGLITASGAPRAAAQFVPVSQARSVSAQVSGDDAYYNDGLGLISDTPLNGSQSYSAMGFEPFASSASEGSSYVNGNASQDSTIGNTIVSASGSAAGGSSISPSGYLHHRWSVGAGGVSSFSLTFDLPAPTGVSLSGLLHGEGSVPFVGVAYITLSQGSRNIANFGLPFPQAGDVPVNDSTTLQAGRYTLSADATDAGAYPDGYFQSSFRFTFKAVPEPATIAAMLVAAPLLLRARRRA